MQKVEIRFKSKVDRAEFIELIQDEGRDKIKETIGLDNIVINHSEISFNVVSLRYLVTLPTLLVRYSDEVYMTLFEGETETNFTFSENKVTISQ